MNAYELADELQIVEDKAEAHAMGHIRSTVADAKVMLRQQADRIAELEKQRWTEKDLKNACRNARLSEDDFLRIKAYLPVYTTPQTKPLSDEEIWNWFKENTALTKESALRIARAIEERHGIK